MKRTSILFSMMFILALLLVACNAREGGNLESLQSNQPTEFVEGGVDQNSDDHIEEQVASDEPEALPETASSFNPTPSPLFEQNYGPNELSDRDYSDLKIVTLLPPDGIPAFTFPDYLSAQEAEQEYDPNELVIGVEFNGDARAYSVSLLSRHEIVNDTVGGIHLAVTW